MNAYTVVVTREATAWLADVPALAGTHTWAKNLPALDRNVREAIAVAEDLPEGAEVTLTLDYDYRLGNTDLAQRLASLRALRAQLERDEQRLAAETADAAVELVEREKLPVRDAAALLAVSAQRISQVAPRSAKSGRVAAPTRRRASGGAKV